MAQGMYVLQTGPVGVRVVVAGIDVSQVPGSLLAEGEVAFGAATQLLQ